MEPLSRVVDDLLASASASPSPSANPPPPPARGGQSATCASAQGGTEAQALQHAQQTRGTGGTSYGSDRWAGDRSSVFDVGSSSTQSARPSAPAHRKAEASDSLETAALGETDGWLASSARLRVESIHLDDTDAESEAGRSARASGVAKAKLARAGTAELQPPARAQSPQPRWSTVDSAHTQFDSLHQPTRAFEGGRAAAHSTARPAFLPEPALDGSRSAIGSVGGQPHEAANAVRGDDDDLDFDKLFDEVDDALMLLPS
ncbi:hypothetical protein T492DRAFT_844429 [Pavlovales sp. CCMP2436]|nr:hypothetical protein T492DRAFT_844429 [Pavlovales sp. CCMP2436]